jgi:hypothetical protein
MRTLLITGLVAVGALTGGCHHIVAHHLLHHHHPRVVVHHPRPVVVVKPAPKPAPVRVVTERKKVLLPHEFLAERHKEHMRWLKGGDQARGPRPVLFAGSLGALLGS